MKAVSLIIASVVLVACGKEVKVVEQVPLSAAAPASDGNEQKDWQAEIDSLKKEIETLKQDSLETLEERWLREDAERTSTTTISTYQQITDVKNKTRKQIAITYDANRNVIGSSTSSYEWSDTFGVWCSVSYLNFAPGGQVTSGSSRTKLECEIMLTKSGFPEVSK